MVIWNCPENSLFEWGEGRAFIKSSSGAREETCMCLIFPFANDVSRPGYHGFWEFSSRCQAGLASFRNAFSLCRWSWFNIFPFTTAVHSYLSREIFFFYSTFFSMAHKIFQHFHRHYFIWLIPIILQAERVACWCPNSMDKEAVPPRDQMTSNKSRARRTLVLWLLPQRIRNIIAQKVHFVTALSISRLILMYFLFPLDMLQSIYCCLELI